MSLTRLSGIVMVLTLGIAIVVLLTSLATGRTSAQAPGDDARPSDLDRVQKVLDHFKCWTTEAHPVINRVAYLQDQFDVAPDPTGQVDRNFETVRVLEPEWFCNATTKIHPTRLPKRRETMREPTAA